VFNRRSGTEDSADETTPTSRGGIRYGAKGSVLVLTLMEGAEALPFLIDRTVKFLSC